QAGQALQFDGVGASGSKGGFETGDDERQSRCGADVATAETGGLCGDGGTKVGHPIIQPGELGLGGSELALDRPDAAADLVDCRLDGGERVGECRGVGRGGAGGGCVQPAFQCLQLRGDAAQ